MSLFGKKKEKLAESTCCCASSSTDETTEVKATNECCGKPVDGVCCVKVLGAGCKSCHQLYESTKEAVEKLGINVEVEYITDMEKVMAYGVMSMPALVVNKQVVSMGKVLKPDEIAKYLQ